MHLTSACVKGAHSDDARRHTGKEQKRNNHREIYLFLGERSARAQKVDKARGDAAVDVQDERFPLLGGHLGSKY